ncbi:hypothetical protein IFM89_009051 [Coptis chinensis]|uniref:Amino acid transporter transmembrane domain-containing protein n=1 Tax=Coptis chinensis TaxID=261450 RepID=A0A835IM43_9MAGN|nr:hypothetical protein IFM89_009051 [Coptis chinensis]
MVSYTITSATSMSFCLCMAKWISHGDIRGSLMGIMSREDATLSSASKTWSTFQALGNIAFAFTYAEVLIEIQLLEELKKQSSAEAHLTDLRNALSTLASEGFIVVQADTIKQI